jgi:hypothetical protein
MGIEKIFFAAAIISLVSLGASTGSASAQAVVPTNALDHIYRSIEDTQREAWSDRQPSNARLFCDPYYGCRWVANPAVVPYGRIARPGY